MNNIIFTIILFLVLLNCRTSSLKFDQSQQEIKINAEDCFSERKNIEQLTLEEGIVNKIGVEYFILDKGKNQRYFACNFPEVCKKEGMRLTCSIITKEIYSYERMMGTPCVLSSIKQIR